MFLYLNLIKINNHIILPDQQHLSDHTSLNINIHISEEFICNKLCTIIKNSKEEEKFIINIIKNIGNINTLSIFNKNSLEAII